MEESAIMGLPSHYSMSNLIKISNENILGQGKYVVRATIK